MPAVEGLYHLSLSDLFPLRLQVLKDFEPLLRRELYVVPVATRKSRNASKEQANIDYAGRYVGVAAVFGYIKFHGLIAVF